MGIAGERVKYVRVVSETCYIFPMAESSGDRTTINGWTVDEVVQAWFRRSPLHRPHASRSYYKAGGYERLVSVEVSDDPPWMEEMSSEEV